MNLEIIDVRKFEYSNETITVELLKWNLGYQVVASNDTDNKWYTSLKMVVKCYKTIGQAKRYFNKVNGNDLKLVR